jgi:hypothetical protein
MNLDLFRKPIDPADVKREQADGVPLLFGFGAGVMKAWLEQVGFPPLTLVRNESPIAGDASLEASSLRLKTLPSRAFGLSSCAIKWKIEPQDKFLNHWQPALDSWARGVKPIKVLGYDGGEARRASIVEDKKLRYWYPLFEQGLDRGACVALIQSEGLPVPPKSACFFCPSSTKSEVLALAERHPELMARALEMERVAAPNLKSCKGLGRQFAWADLLRANAAERESFAEQPVESCLVCVDQPEDA